MLLYNAMDDVLHSPGSPENPENEFRFNDMLLHTSTDRPVEFLNAYVDPERRNKGIGRALAGRLEEIALQAGHTEIIVNSGPRYKDSGWIFWTRLYGEPITTQKDYYGPGADAKIWRKLLK
jgi:GNAT superfamily N-acetyltransferase